jgi:N-acetyl-1-D-myo-inositol-2-amino-2-deoxy-alpha-D-glucopyranoside deacetylase
VTSQSATPPDEEQPKGPTAPATSAEQAVLDAAQDVVEEAAGSEPLAQAEPAMDALDNPRRLLLVHAHPDDETIQNGATMAHYAANGAAVTLVTCTRGELGEVIPADLAHLEGDGEALAEIRAGELAAAMEALGVSDHRFLGSDAGVSFHDSGMVYDDEGRAVAPPNMHSGAFAHVPVDEAAAHLVRVLRQVRPQVLITYDPDGGYGHPDHVQAHRVAMRAVELAADAGYGAGEPWRVSKVYWTAAPVEQAVEWLREAQRAGVQSLDPDGPLPSVLVPSSVISAVVEADDQLPAKAAALRAHATQVVVHEQTMSLSNGMHSPLTGTEYYRLAVGERAAPDGELETDLFAGIGSG